MERTYDLEKFQQEWRNKLRNVFWGMDAICFLTEVLIIVVRLFAKRLDSDTVLLATVKDVIIPTLVNVLNTLIVIGINSSNADNKHKNRAFVYGVMAFAACIVCFHGYLEWTLSMFALPIVASTIFADKVMTRRTLTLGSIIMFVCIPVSWVLDPNFSLPGHFIMGVVNEALLGTTYLIAVQVVNFLSQKDEIIEDQSEDNENLIRALTLDPMTSLYNHAEFNRVSEAKYRESRENGTSMTMVVVDIDHFKRVNDTYGHEQGDVVLIELANQLMHDCSDKGQVFRYGGEEFAVIFMNMTAGQAYVIMDDLRESFSKKKYDFMPNETVTISVGVYEYSGEEDMTAQDIFNCADAAMYAAKNTGRNRCWIY